MSDDEKAKIKSEISSYGIPEYSGEPLSVLKHRYDLIQIQKISVTTTDIKRDYVIIGPVFYQINDAGSGKMIFQKQKEYRNVINSLKDQNQLVNQKASISEALGTISSFFELINTGYISASTKDLLGNGHTQFDEAFFISVEELKNRLIGRGTETIDKINERLSIAEEELKEAKKAIEILGGEIEKIDEITLPNTDIKRKIVVIKKVKNTPSKYPRKAGTPAKEPII